MTEIPIIETATALICSANQWTGFYMIEASVIKELIECWMKSERFKDNLVSL